MAMWRSCSTHVDDLGRYRTYTRNQLACRYWEFRRKARASESPDQLLYLAQRLSYAARAYPRVKAWIWIQVARVYARQGEVLDAVLCAQRVWRIAKRCRIERLPQAMVRRGWEFWGTAPDAVIPNGAALGLAWPGIPDDKVKGGG